MTRSYVIALLMGFALLLVTVELLRRQHLREKYAALWIFVGLIMLAFAAIPGLLSGLSRALGFALPANLLFLGGGVLLTTISMQLSAEIGRLESESQRLAEEIALLRIDVDRLSGRSADQPTDTDA
jgi:hypothetical protein